MTNPLLTMDSLPPFSQIQPDQVQPAVTQAIADCKQKIEDVLAQKEPHTWDSLIAPLEEVNDRLSRIWSPVSHLNAVQNSEALRVAHDACLPLLSEFQTYVGQHEGLYQAYRELAIEILDPVVRQYGQPRLTYGFCGTELRRAILTNQSPGIAPGLDQHAACELNQRGRVICPRQGAAVDLIYPGKNSYQVALWLAQHTPFDRLYLYGPDRPLHISYGPEQNRALVELTTHHGRRMPKRLTLTQLKGMC